MPNSKNQRRVPEEKSRRGTLGEKSSSFHGRLPVTMVRQLQRPKTLPDLLSGRNLSVGVPEDRPRLTKLLLKVTIQGSVGPVQVVMSPDSTVNDLVAATLKQYAKEGRRLILKTSDPAAFGLHYSQFSLESLDRTEVLMTLGSRNFFLCPMTTAGIEGENGTTSSCANEAGKAAKTGLPPWLKFMDFLF